MTILEQINEDFVIAYKAKDEAKVSTLRMLKTAIKNAEIEKKSALSDSDVVSVLKKEQKTRIESANEFEKGGRADLSEKERNEAKIIENYLPEQISVGELDQEIAKILSDENIHGSENFGQAMKIVMPALKDKADGSQIAESVRKILNQ